MSMDIKLYELNVPLKDVERVELEEDAEFLMRKWEYMIESGHSSLNKPDTLNGGPWLYNGINQKQKEGNK